MFIRDSYLGLKGIHFYGVGEDKKSFFLGCGFFFDRYYGPPCFDVFRRVTTDLFGARLFFKNK
jgi:hypothetical protein